MSKLMITIFMFLAITAALMGLSNMLSKKTIIDREKSSPFECGFDSMNLSRMPFSLRFFLLGLIFLVFDVEICLILPSILTFKVSNMKLWFTTVMVMLIILIWGLFHEWFMGSLDWKN